MVEELYFHAWISTYKDYDVYQNYVKGWVPNAIYYRVDFYTVYIEVDLIPPNITIHSPTPNQLFGTIAPGFSITITNQSPISFTWYTIDGGLTNYTFSGLTGTINQTAWDNENSGPITIRFYAKDEVGNVNSSQVIVRKDTIMPNITIDNPIADEIFGNTSPDFTIEVIEENLDSTWYTVEGDITLYPFTGLTGTINQDAWDDAPEGDVTITFYAEDSVGNIGSESVVVIKHISTQEPAIPGYNVIWLLGAISVISIILMKKQKH